MFTALTELRQADVKPEGHELSDLLKRLSTGCRRALENFNDYLKNILAIYAG